MSVDSESLSLEVAIEGKEGVFDRSVKVASRLIERAAAVAQEGGGERNSLRIDRAWRLQALSQLEEFIAARDHFSTIDGNSGTGPRPRLVRVGDGTHKPRRDPPPRAIPGQLPQLPHGAPADAAGGLRE